MKNYGKFLATSLVIFCAGVNTQAQFNVAEPAFAFGHRGSGPGEFNEPRGVGVGFEGNVYVSDALNYRVQVFTREGIYLSEFGYQGTAPDAMDAPLDLAVHTDGHVFVLDSYNHRVQKFDAGGSFIKVWGGLGSAIGKFNLPRCLALDKDGNVYVADGYNNRIQKFSNEGEFILSFGGFGTVDGKMRVPVGIAVDHENNVYIADQGNYRIQKFSSDGKFITKWGSRGSKPGQFQTSPNADGGPNGMTVDPAGNLVVTDGGNNRIQIFTSTGRFITQFGGPGSELGQMNLPGRVTFNADGSILYITDIGNVRIQAFIYTVPQPAILAVSRQDNNATLSWSAIPGRTYQLQSKSNLNETQWSSLGQPVTPTAYPATNTLPIGSDPQQIIRVALVP